MASITGKYIFIAHGKQLTIEKYDFEFNFESLSFFVPAGYVLENPQNTFSSSIVNIPQILCENRLNLDIISKVAHNNIIKLRKMRFTVSQNDLLTGNEVFYQNAGLYYCGTNRPPIKILNWENLKQLNQINFKMLFDIINNHAFQNNINPRTTGVFLYTCRSSCVEPKKGYVKPRLLPIKGKDKIIGVSGPSINQRTGKLMITPYIQRETDIEESDIVGGTYKSRSTTNMSNLVNVDEDLFYQYNSEQNIKRDKIKTKNNKRRNTRRKSNHKYKLSKKHKYTNKSKRYTSKGKRYTSKSKQ